MGEEKEYLGLPESEEAAKVLKIAREGLKNQTQRAAGQLERVLCKPRERSWRPAESVPAVLP